jgi:hypothetical protein
VPSSQQIYDVGFAQPADLGDRILVEAASPSGVRRGKGNLGCNYFIKALLQARLSCAAHPSAMKVAKGHAVYVNLANCTMTISAPLAPAQSSGAPSSG